MIASYTVITTHAILRSSEPKGYRMIKKVSDEFTKKELLEIADLMEVEHSSKDTKPTLVAKINAKVDELNGEKPKKVKLLHSTGEVVSEVQKHGYRGRHPVTGEPL